MTPALGAGISTLALSVSSSKQRLVGGDALAVVLHPADDHALGDRLAEGRDLDVNGHAASSSARSTSSVCSRWCILYDPVAGLAASSRPT